MARPKASDPREHQVLMRLTTREMRVLEAVAHLSKCTPSAFALSTLLSRLDAAAGDPFVQADISNREAYDRAVDAVTADISSVRAEQRRQRTSSAQRANDQRSDRHEPEVGS